MRKLFILVLVARSLLGATASAQQQKNDGTTNITVIGPGATSDGDIARGQGVFLQGLGWYELNDAKAAAIYSETMRKNDAYLRQQIEESRRAYNAQVDAQARKQKMNEAARKQYLAERESRLRTKPTAEDIQKGDALNALLTDLSDPTIHPSSWRGGQVSLPDDISIKRLAFQFTPKPGAKGSDALAKGLIALGRLDTAGRWPDVFPMAKLQGEIPAYEASYKTIEAQALGGRIEIEAIDAMDRSLNSLEASVGKVVSPNRGFRSLALQYVRNLRDATRMFDATTLDFAREMIADTHQHEAHNVGELLAFMRKYRLMFARADAAPGGDEMYARLYGLLRQQSEALGIKPEQMALAKLDKFPPQFREGSIWEGVKSDHRFVVRMIDGDQFEADFRSDGGRFLRHVKGVIEGETIKWLAKDVDAIQGGPGGDNYMNLQNGQISLSWSNEGGPLQSGIVLKLRNSNGADLFQTGSVWVGSIGDHRLNFMVLARQGEKFKARFEDGSSSVREIEGIIRKGKISWSVRDVRVIRGTPGNDNSGSLIGEEISMRYVGPTADGTYLLRYQGRR